MATITLDTDKLKEAGVELPEGEKVHFSFAFSEFDLGAGDSVDVDSVEDEGARADLAANAPVHPWLKVELSEPKEEQVEAPKKREAQPVATPETVAETRPNDAAVTPQENK